MSNKYYAGIGSRSTPFHIQKIMYEIGREWAKFGYILRSGGADGADKAFESGCDSTDGKKQIFLPWRYFNGSSSEFYTISNEMIQLASQYHPAWDKCNHSAKALHARNTQQVLGPDLKSPSKFIICWTKNGEVVGGTGLALRLAEAHKIPIYNLGCPNIKVEALYSQIIGNHLSF